MGHIYDHLELIGPRLLVRPMPDLNVTKGGIVLPDATQHQQNRAIVEKVGPGELLEKPIVRSMPTSANDCSQGEISFRTQTLERRPMTVAVGDLVLYQKYAGTWVVLDGVQRLMLLEEEIQARIARENFVLITHNDENEHLEGEPCLTCSAPTEATARERLAQMRQDLVADSSPSA